MKKANKNGSSASYDKGAKSPSKHMDGSAKKNMVNLAPSKTGAKAPVQFMKAVKAGC
jgi:hypothetical protein